MSNRGRRHGFDANVFVNFTNAYSIIGIVSPTQNERVSAFATIDATLAYTFGAQSGALHDLRLAINASNLFNQAPPLAVISTTQQYDPANANLIGRQIALQLTKKF